MDDIQDAFEFVRFYRTLRAFEDGYSEHLKAWTKAFKTVRNEKAEILAELNQGGGDPSALLEIEQRIRRGREDCRAIRGEYRREIAKLKKCLDRMALDMMAPLAVRRKESTTTGENQNEQTKEDGD